MQKKQDNAYSTHQPGMSMMPKNEEGKAPYTPIDIKEKQDTLEPVGSPVLDVKKYSYIKYILLAGIALSCITNISRADYNLPLFAFLFLGSVHLPELRLPGLIVTFASIVVDVVWFIFIHHLVFRSSEYMQMVAWEDGIRIFALIVSLILFVLKVRSL